MPLYNSDIPPRCEYCRHGRPAPDADAILCVKQGIMLPSSSCSKFKYDALKRKPRKAPKLFTDYDPDEFKL